MSYDNNSRVMIAISKDTHNKLKETTTKYGMKVTAYADRAIQNQILTDEKNLKSI